MDTSDLFRYTSKLRRSARDREFFLDPVFDRLEGKPFHYCDRTGPWDCARIEQDLHDHLICSHFRSRESGTGNGWCRLLFELADGCFVYTITEYLCVLGSDRPTVMKRFLELERRYLDVEAQATACFHLLRQTSFSVDTTAISLASVCVLSPENMDSHYSPGIAKWESEVIEILSSRSRGITLLRGEPGTGKTTFLRHLVGRLNKSHVFYYLPTTMLKWLDDPRMVEFWAENAEQHKDRQRVLIIEDAEALIAPRPSDSNHTLSTLLNSADGLLGEFLQLHVVLTVNTRMDRIDPAILRPGRLVAFREFRRIPPEQARRLASKQGRHLDEQADYSLAEIYHQSLDSNDDSPAMARAIGFQP